MALANAGITRGCNPPQNTKFCPDDKVTRGQMAAFLVRAFGLPAAKNTFVDDDGHVFEADIAALAAAGITKGCNPPKNDRFCPDDYVTRGQMAAFLNRALGLEIGSTSFTDTHDHIFRGDIAALAYAEITKGCNPPANTKFCPDEYVTRGQMAAFLTRGLGLETPTVPPPPASGTWTDPVRIGAWAELVKPHTPDSSWRMRVTEIVPDAYEWNVDRCIEKNQNRYPWSENPSDLKHMCEKLAGPPPPPGSTYILFFTEIEYLGTGSDNSPLLSVYGPERNQYDVLSDSCPLFYDAVTHVNSVGRAYPGVRYTVAHCFKVAQRDANRLRVGLYVTTGEPTEPIFAIYHR